MNKTKNINLKTVKTVINIKDIFIHQIILKIIKIRI